MTAEIELIKMLMDQQKPRPAELAAVVHRGERFVDVRRARAAAVDIAFPVQQQD